MNAISFDQPKSPFSRFEAGGVYEWPDIPLMIQMRGCLRMTCCGDGEWAAESYRGDPMPASRLGPILESMILANRCFRVLRKETVAAKRTDVKDFPFDVVGGDIEYRTRKVYYGGGEWGTEEHSPFIKRGGKVIYEERVPA